MKRYKQRGIYFSPDLENKIQGWIGLHPHVKLSHLVREALFEYFENHRDKLNVDASGNSASQSGNTLPNNVL